MRSRHRWAHPGRIGRRWLVLSLLVLLVLLSACGNRRASRTTPAAAANASASPAAVPGIMPVDALQLAPAFDGQAAFNFLARLADPFMQGRHVGTPGELQGANYIASQFASAGLEPAGDSGTFLQAFPMTVEELESTPTLELVADQRRGDVAGAGGQARTLKLRDDFRPIYGGLAGAGEVSGPGLFVAADADLNALNVKGKVLFVLSRVSLKDLVTRARDAGALAVIIPTGEQPILKSEGSPPDANAIPVAEVSQTGAATLLEGSGHTRDELNAAQRARQPVSSFPLAWTVSYSVKLRPPANIEAHNVLGVLPGPVGSKSVLVGAHFEEIGPDPDGVVYPAANDNASGVSVMLELAAMFHRLNVQANETIVFAAWSGHEEGLFGSRYYVDHPARPLDRTALYLNLDTVGQGSGRTIDAYAADTAASALGERTVQRLQGGGQNGLAAKVHSIPKAAGDSDDITFSRAGVPTLALSWTGLFDGPHIHTPEDTAGSIDAEKLAVTGSYAAAVLAEAGG